MKPRTNVAPPVAGGPMPPARVAGARFPLANKAFPAPPPAPLRLRGTNPLSSMALAVYVFLFSALAGEFLAVHGGIRFPLIAICLVLIFILYLFAGRPFEFVHTPFFVPWCALLFWWLLAGAAGFYKGRSVPFVLEYAIRVHTLPLIFCGIAVDLGGVRKILYGCGFALLAILAACFKWGTMMYEDRFLIPETSLGNANDLALRLLMFGCLFLIFFSGGLAARFLGLLTLPVLTYYLLRTGSRANLLTGAVILAMSFFLLPGKKKMLPLLVVLAGFCAVPFVAEQTINRLRSFFYVPTDLQTEQAVDQARTAIDSTVARMQLQRRAIELTMEHPLLGVGPQNFTDAVEEMVQKEENRRSGWQVAHNAYLQVSAETGIPGMILFIWIIGMCLVTNYRSYCRLQGEPALISFVILLASVTYAIGILFCSVAYDIFLPLLVGLTTASQLALGRQKTQPLVASQAAVR